MHCLMTNDISMLVSMENVSIEMSLDTCFVRMLMATANGFISLIRLALVLERGAVVIFRRIDGSWLLEELKSHTTICVPDQVTVHEPGTRIVGLKTNNSPSRNECLWGAATEKQGSVAANRVIKAELTDHVGGENSSALSKNGEIVSVKMHRMRCLEIVLDHKVDPIVGRAIEDGSITVQRAVVGQAGEGGQGLKRGLFVGHIDCLAAGRGTTVGGEVS